jgi:hypothetical protein
MANPTGPNDASRKSKAEGDRWKSDSDAVERYDQNVAGDDTDNAGGITNRPLDEEIDNQEALPRRRTSRDGAHAGHGDNARGDEGSEP